MKILICGKGGSGKSTIAAMTALALRERGFRVLVVDMDESNDGLHRFLGLNKPVHLLDDLGGKSGLRQKMKSAFPGGSPGGNLFKRPFTIDNLPPQWVAGTDGIRLLVVGKIDEFGEGCACPLGGLTRAFLSGLELRDKDVVIIDTAAGVEHFGRGIDRLADVIVCVVDPTYASLTLAERMETLAKGAKTALYFVFNKVDDSVEQVMEDRFPPGRLIARIPKDPSIFRAGLEGKTLVADRSEIDPICRLAIDLA